MDLGLAGHIAVVTGGTRGIGKAVCRTLASEGCHVSLCARDPRGLEETMAELQAFGIRTHGSTLDVTVAGAIEQFIDATAARFGEVHHLVANVGGTVGQDTLDATVEEWTATFHLNVGHSLRAIQATVPHMHAPGACSIVIIASISGWKPGPRAQYGAAKAAEIFMAGALAQELAPKRIRINAVSPGSILFPGGRWDRFRQEHAKRFEAFMHSEFPWQRLGTAEEVADVVTFLLSERAKWINGAHIPVDGAQVNPTVS